MLAKGKKNTIRLEDILKEISEYDLLYHYLNITEIPCVINSPLRTDNHPSMALSSTNGTSIFYYDYRTRESGSVFGLLSKHWSMPFEDALKKINSDLPNIVRTGKKLEKSFAKPIGTIGTKSVSDLKCRVREFRKYDFEFWEQFGISERWLKFGEIYPITHIIIVKDGQEMAIPADKYAYAYVEYKDGKPSLKIYQPYNKTYKWINKHDSSVWDLWDKLPEKGEYLIITSSRKDALCIWENTGIPTVSLQAESYLPKEHVVKSLKERFKYVFVLYDNDFTKEDNPGEALGKYIAETFDLIQLHLPLELGEKDTSDLCKKYGRNKVRKVIYTLINTIKSNEKNNHSNQ